MAFALCLPGTFGWNDDGHRIAAKIALAFTRPRTDSFVSRILGENAEASLVSSSTWADEITDSRPETSRMHFSHTPYRACDAYAQSRDCPSGECIVESITRFTEIASAVDSSAIERREALMFLIHLVADIHQPLHVGFRNDSGGTQISFPPTDLTLHQLWDYDILNHHIARHHAGRWENLVSDLIDSDSIGVFRGDLMIDNSEFERGRFASAIASETAQMFTCTFAYKNMDRNWIKNGDVKPGRDYYQSRSRIITNQLFKAGVRLAKLLDYIANRYKQNMPARVPVPRSVAVVEISPPPMSSFTNRFAVLLDLDVDIDEIAVTYVVDEEEEADDGPVEETAGSRQLKSASKKKKRFPRKNRSHKKPLSSPRVVDGIRLDDLIIVKRRAGRLYVTYPDRVKDKSANWSPVSSIPIQVRFRNDDEARIFHLDATVFRLTIEPSREFLTSLFTSLGGCQSEDAPPLGTLVEAGLYQSERDKKSPLSIMLSTGITSDEYDNMMTAQLREAERLYAASRAHLTQVDILRETRTRTRRSNDRFRQRIHELVFVSAGRILLVTTFDKAIDTTNTTMVVNRFDYNPVTAKSTDDTNIMYIDTTLFNDDMTAEIFGTITQLKKQSDYVSRTIHALRVNRLLYEQLKRLSDAIFKTDYSKGPALIGSLTNFEKIIRYDKPYLRTFVIDYALTERNRK